MIRGWPLSDSAFLHCCHLPTFSALKQLKALDDAAAEASKAKEKEKGLPEGAADAQRYVCL